MSSSTYESKDNILKLVVEINPSTKTYFDYYFPLAIKENQKKIQKMKYSILK